MDSGIACPDCAMSMNRIRRSGLMRLMPGSRHYQCLNCGTRYLRLLGLKLRIS
jgi:hypothetical protein